MKNLDRLLLLTALALLVSCTDPTGTSPSEGTPSSTTTISATPASGASRIVGTTKYSPDGGITQTDAAFVFDVPTTAVSKAVVRAASMADLISVSGYLRAGSLLIELTGTYDQVTKQFTLRASGTLATTRIDITISGTHDPATGTLSAGQTDVAVTDTTGSTPPKTFSTTVAKPADAAAEKTAIDSIVTAKTDASVQVAAAPSKANQKFWEGNWSMTYRVYTTDNTYTTFTGNNGTDKSSYYVDATQTLLGTGSQYNVAGTQRRSDGTVQTFVQNFTLVSSVSQSASELVGVFLITANSGDATLVGQYQKMKLYLLPDGTLWGGGYVSATAANDYFVATVDDALTHTVFENYVPATGMSKLN